MLTSLGFVDLAARYGESVYGTAGANVGADQLSAMPSVHVCWSVLVAWAVITASPSRWRWLILAHPIVTVFVVVGTGNHYWADAIVSVAIVAVVLATQALLRARPARFRRARFERARFERARFGGAASGASARLPAAQLPAARLPTGQRARERQRAWREGGQPAVWDHGRASGQRRKGVSRSRCDSFSGLRTE
jgi:PAP2 superfamily